VPEMLFAVRWPDGTESRCYSPSLVISDHLAVGVSYPVAEFVDRSRTALLIASERVRAKYGMVCTSALAQLDAIERTAARMPEGDVTVTAFHSGPGSAAYEEATSGAQ
jgi:uncharacterized repeat protein (TIGR04042 family)